MKGLIVHPVVWEHLCGILKVSKGFPKLPMKFPGVDGGGDFIQREVFQALPEGKGNQKMGKHMSL
jgi:hypothetical protein